MKYLFYSLLAFVGVVWGCEQHDMVDVEATLQEKQLEQQESVAQKSSANHSVRLMDEVEICGTETVYDLTAGQHNLAGSLTVYNDAENLYVAYLLTNEETFNTLHLWVGSEVGAVPSNKQGTPVPGKFPYHYDATGLHSHTFVIPLSDVGEAGSEVVIFAHAEVAGETAWGGEVAINVSAPGRWYYYANYMIKSCLESNQTAVESSQTAFAKGEYVFASDSKSNPDGLPSLNISKSRWGWAINLQGEGTATYPIWAAAGLNNTNKGEKVGELIVEYAGGEVKISYNFYHGYSFSEVHIYVNDVKPTSIAPGTYGHTETFAPRANSYTADFSSITDTDQDGIWIIAHAVAYGQF